ncbi:GPP34 family phosphoprotein [Micromonospora sp. WMMD1128]|uniref:GOLPH3/VPS74 family protein n=1 Tax=unclassified Micromonospora TaxID=2617518 RepID=UPI00248C9466|nr:MULTISPECIES: GPP34 family phosphoprotein [unclassified Micromonospora]WBB73607.1 GPP34 family phosphoprotein [Micromonospora sp. WMMD1128]WFE33000.1 GPP34 family phosphoprotein [Micromonospora sp. WMMD975]
MDGLLLTDELVLLAYDDGGANRLGRPHLDYGLAGALLLELALARRVEVADKRLVVTDPTPTGVPLLDEALATVGAGRPRKPKDWIGKLSKGLPDRVLDGLVGAGVLRRESDRVLLVFPRTRYPSPTGAEPAAETAARERMVAALVGNGPVDARTAALLTLARAVGLDRKLFRELPKERVKARLNEIAAGDWASAAVKKAIDEMQAAVIVATTVASTAAISAGS